MTRLDAPLAELARIFTQRFVEDRCVQIASSLTFTTMLAIVPIATIALTVAGTFPVFASLLAHVQAFIVDSLVPNSVDAITGYTEQFYTVAELLCVADIDRLQRSNALNIRLVELHRNPECDRCHQLPPHIQLARPGRPFRHRAFCRDSH